MPIFDNATYTVEELKREKVGRVLLDQMVESGEVTPFDNPGHASHYLGDEINKYMRAHRKSGRKKPAGGKSGRSTSDGKIGTG